MPKIVIDCEELPSNREAKDFFKEVLINYLKECEISEFEIGFQKVKLTIK